MSDGIVVLVCGGRDFRDYDTVAAVLDALHAERTIARLVHGGAPGADGCAHAWAVRRRVPAATYPADWNAHGRAAGPIRNAEMLRAESPDIVVAFPGGRGTRDMTTRAQLAGVPVRFHEALLPSEGP